MQLIHRIKQTNNKMASLADATSNNNKRGWLMRRRAGAGAGALGSSPGTAFFPTRRRRCLVDQAKILIESTSTFMLFTSRQHRDCCFARTPTGVVIVVVPAAALIKFLNNFPLSLYLPFLDRQWTRKLQTHKNRVELQAIQWYLIAIQDNKLLINKILFCGIIRL